MVLLVLMRILAIALATVWLTWSAARGGIHESLRYARAASLCFTEPVPQPDAREQWSGPYFDALDVLVRERPQRGATVAAALSSSDLPSYSGAPPARMYETVYRLYPARPDFWQPDHTWLWGGAPASQMPRVQSLWAHDLVLWAAPESPAPPHTCRLIYRNSAARLYRRAPG